MYCEDSPYSGWNFTVTDVLARKWRNFPSSFAKALAARSQEALLQLVRKPTVAELLAERPGVLNELEASALRLRRLEDLAQLLDKLDAMSEGSEQLLLLLVPGVTASFPEGIGRGKRENSFVPERGELIAWLQLAVWVRCCAVALMQRLVAVHERISVYAWYWSWAEKHPTRASFHLSLSSFQWLRRQFCGFFSIGWGSCMFHVALVANAHGVFLRRAMYAAVRGVGTLHNILDRTNASIAAVEEGTTWLPASSMVQHQERYQRVLQGMRSAVTRAVCELGDSLQSWCIPEDPMDPLANGVQRPCVDDAVSLLDVVRLFHATLHLLQSNIKGLEERVDERHMPPRGRRWRPIAFFLFVIAPSTAWFATGGARKVLQVCASARATLRWMVSNYVVWPLQEVRRSLLGSRPGVLERRRALEEEMKSVANIICDYCKECSDDMGNSNRLEQLRHDTLRSLRTGVMADDEGYMRINRDFESAIKKPIRSTLFGNLPRLILVQLACKQLEVNRVINVTGEILEENDLNFRVMAMIPVITFLGGILQLSLQNKRVKRRPVILHLKLCWWAVHRLVTFPEVDDAHQRRFPRHQIGGSSPSTSSGDGALVSRLGSRRSAYLSEYDQGMLLLLTHHMRRIAMEYYPAYHHLKNFLEDLDCLESVWSTRQQRILTLDRMWHTFHFLSQRSLAT